MKFSSKFKKAAFGLTAIATSLFIGITAGCSQNGGSNDDDDDDKVTTKEDVQEIKNGNFEFYDDNDGLYPISTPDNWSFSSNGSSSNSMSGVIKTSKEGWEYLTDPTLPDTLKANDELKSDDENKKDYNGAMQDDMLYKNMHKALEVSSSDDENADKDKKAYIENPNTHDLRWDAESEKYVDNEGNTVDVHTKDGKLYSDSEYKNEIGTSVLMIHNFRSTGNYRGTEGYFNSSTKLTLEANTACKISLWVKTAELYSDDSKNERTEVTFNKGAYIKVGTSVGGNDLDSFTVKNINTEILNPDETDDDGKVTKAAENNGWVQYTLYVQASSFAETTVNLTLGLGENGSNEINTVEGYAFFDDITYEKYFNLGKLKEDNADFDTAIRSTDAENNPANTCYPLAADAKTSFRVDVPKYQTQDGNGGITEHIEENNTKDRHFFIDFASTEATPLEFKSSTVQAGLTVDGDKYISSKNADFKNPNIGVLDNGATTAKLPTNLKNNGRTVSDDLLTLTDIGENWSASTSFGDYKYNDTLQESLASASTLPGVNATASTLIMLSANGAAYEAKITDDAFTVDDGEYKLISFWLKTSDFGGKTAATVTVYDPTDEDNASNFALDTTTVATTDFDGEKDVYDGWVRCFVRVSNTSGKAGAKQFAVKVNLGLTSIKGTSSTDYKYGWLALTNLSVMDLDEDVYGYTSSLSNKAELSYSETNETFSKPFDDEQGGTNNEIKTDLATPSTYTGANGASVAVKPTGETATDYATTNNNKFAGLLNRENIANYKDKAWYNAIYNKLPGSPLDSESAVWEALAGRYSYQPLLIVNAAREVSDGLTGIYNYGYIGNKESVSADAYKKVSVRVKVSEGAVAYVYLIDTDTENNDPYTYELPEYNFYYDDNGNILTEAVDNNDTKSEANAKIAYKLRKDGLYESVNGDGKLYANFHNLTKYYDYKFEHESFFDESGKAVAFEDLKTGETYYADAAKTKYAPHYLIAGGKENNKVYEYCDGKDGETTYYYMEKGVANKKKVVYGVDTKIARYSFDETTATPYSFKIDGNAKDDKGNYKYANKWITVTFNVHAGNVAKNYRLELWAGDRSEKQTEGVAENSYVLFDYSPEQETSLDSSSYSTKVNYYTNAIRADLIENIEGGLPDNDQNITQLEKLAGDGYNKIYNYDAMYYTFSLYDSSAFIPFNGETAEEGQSGYSYLYSDYDEALAFLKVEDLDDANNCSMTAFVDYSVKDKAVDIIGEPTVDTDTDTDEEEKNTNETNIWLLAASIAVTAAILVAMIALFVKWLIGKYGKKKVHVSKNSYNFNKNKRYVKKYVKANGEAPEVNENEVDENLLKQEASTPTETSEEAPAETPVENTEAPAESEQPAAPAEDPATPAENAEEAKPEGTDENKPE